MKRRRGAGGRRASNGGKGTNTARMAPMSDQIPAKPLWELVERQTRQRSVYRRIR